MSKIEDKAEQRALEAYPVLMCYNDFQMVEEDINKPLREIYQDGYHQAEKDLELTWEDMVLFRTLFDATDANIRSGLKIQPMTKEYYQEVLKRFKAQKGE